MAATLRNYLDQIALTLRPSTVTRAEAILREFACFLTISAPEVGRIAARMGMQMRPGFLAESTRQHGREEHERQPLHS